MEESNAGERAIWFLAGMAVGAGLGILFAPKSGRETREYIGERAARGRDYVSQTGKDVYEKGRELYERGKGLAEEAGELIDRGRRAVGRGVERT